MQFPLYLLIFLALLSQSQWAYSSQPLNRKLVDAFFITADKMDHMEEKFPEVTKRADKFKPSEEAKLISYLESSKAYPEIKSILSSSGLKNLNEFFKLSERIMGSVFAVQMKNMPAGMSMGSVEKMFEQNIDMMRKNGMPADELKKMEKELKEQKADRVRMEAAMKKATPADKKFVTDNLQWLMSRFPEDDVSENPNH